MELCMYHESLGPRVTAALVAAAQAALDAGADTRGVSALMLHLADSARINGGPLPEAIPVAKRLLAIAASEAEPYCGSTFSAKKLLSPSLSHR